MDANEISALADAIIAGTPITPEQARTLLDVADGTPAFAALLDGATRIRDHFVGSDLRCCSILNTKAGNCSENCSYCAQSKISRNVDYAKHPWLDDGAIEEAAASAAENGAGALGLVAAWKGLRPGRQLDMVCKSIATLRRQNLKADASLGLIDDPAVAVRLKEAGLQTYHHNLETAESFFPQTCTTHTWAERQATIAHVKAAGLHLCSGGIFGLGETLDQRIEFLFQVQAIEPDSVPINFFSPVEGSALENREPMSAAEGLVLLAVCRFVLHDRTLMVCGGKEVTFGDRLAETLRAGASGVMVGNYLTTNGTPADFWESAAAAAGMAFSTGRGCCS